jgi:hypothetical protein
VKLTFVEVVHGEREVEAREPFNKTSFVWLGTNGLTNACLIRHMFDKEREDMVIATWARTRRSLSPNDNTPV